MLTKKHFETFAAITGHVRNRRDRTEVGEALANLSMDQNPDFDHNRFWLRVDEIVRADLKQNATRLQTERA